MSVDRFAVSLTCIDGRVHAPLVSWVRAHLDADVVDLVTAPGPELVLTSDDTGAVARLVEGFGVSVRAHGSRHLVIASHSDCCAGYPVDDIGHVRALAAATARMAALLPDLLVTGLHVTAVGTSWTPVPLPQWIGIDAAL